MIHHPLWDNELDEPGPHYVRIWPEGAKAPFVVIESYHALRAFKLFMFFMLIAAIMLASDLENWYYAILFIFATAFICGSMVLVETILSRERQSYYVP